MPTKAEEKKDSGPIEYTDSDRPGFHVFSAGGTKFEIPKRYRFIKAIGTGAYGVVISASDSVTDTKVAIKKIPHAFDDLVDAKRILREIKLLRHFNHENIINCLDLIPPPGLACFDDVYIVNDLMETDLHRVIYSRQALGDEHIQYFVYQMIRALKYMHSAEVLHRDLKPSNILVNSTCDLKICDFGLARGIEAEDTTANPPDLTEYVVTRWYRAPEIMLACRTYTKAVDVWSIGCIFAELLGRKPLFPGEDYMGQLRLIADVLGTPSDDDLHFVSSEKAKKFMKGLGKKPKVSFSKLFPSAPPDACDLLEKMLDFDPTRRITVNDALKHKYLESLVIPDDEPDCDSHFEFKWEKDELDKETLQKFMAEEIRTYYPDSEIARELDKMSKGISKK